MRDGCLQRVRYTGQPLPVRPTSDAAGPLRRLGWEAGALAGILRQGATMPPGDVERAAARALEVLCPAA